MRVLLFVYGTLAPGEVSWPRLQPHVSAHRPAAVPGRLYDTGRGYPGAVFAPGADVVQGCLCEVDHGIFDELDAFEGDEYERIAVRCEDGTHAVAYHWIASLDGCEPIGTGNWVARR